MDFEFQLLGVLLAASAQVVSQLTTLLRANARDNAVAQGALEAAIESADLKTLGSYLDRQLGAIDVARYASRKDSRERVDRVLARLEDFLGPSEGAQVSVPGLERVLEGEAPIELELEIDDLPSDVAARLQAGDGWGALVRLRKELDVAATAVLRSNDLEVPGYSQAARLAAIRKAKLVDSDALAAADLARVVANKAVHGSDLGRNELVTGLRAGVMALRVFRRNAERKVSSA